MRQHQLLEYLKLLPASDLEARILIILSLVGL
jgi:hypothetical protein